MTVSSPEGQHGHWEGQEKEVDLISDKEVLAKYRENIPPNLIKADYYLNNILEALFPHQIPHISKAGDSSYLAEYIKHDKQHDSVQELNKRGKEIEAVVEEERISADPRIIELNEKLQNLGIYSDNKSGRNYIINPQDIAVYIDPVRAWEPVKILDKKAPNQTRHILQLNFDMKIIEQKVLQLSEPARSHAQKNLIRLKELWAEESQKTDLSEYLKNLHI